MQVAIVVLDDPFVKMNKDSASFVHSCIETYASAECRVYQIREGEGGKSNRK